MASTGNLNIIKNLVGAMMMLESAKIAVAACMTTGLTRKTIKYVT